MKTNFTIFRLLAVAFVLASSIVNAFSQQTRDQVFIGARPMAMGETFVAIADDGTAIYWNPAGLPYLRKYEINFAYANLLGVGVDNAYLSLFAPVTRRFVLGADWFRLGFDDVANDLGLEFSQNIFHFSFACKLLENLSIGANFKYVNMDGSEDQVAVGKANGTGYDVGLLFSPSDWLGAPFDKLRFGVMVHDVTDTDVTFDNGVSDTILKRNIRYGISYRPLNNLVVGLDLDDRLHVGAEYWLFNTLALRGGWQKDQHTSEGAIFSFGLGLARNLPALERVQTNYAFMDHPASLNTNQFSAGIAFDLFLELIEIEKVEMDDVYASQYKYHSKTSIGKAYVKYNGKTVLKNCKIGTSILPYSDLATGILDLMPGDSLCILPIRAVFAPSVLDAQQTTTPLVATFRISYLSGGRERHAFLTSELTLHKRGTIDWSKGTAQAAAFIDPSDENVNAVAKNILKKYEDDPGAAIPGEENLSQAMQIFNALGEMGIYYEKDPENPYAKAYKSLDKIYYPVETLQRKKGDCDDTSILYAALLESCDIPTALVAVPGHLLMMLDTGILESDRENLLPEASIYYPFNGSFWIPVETTLLADKSFLNAWRAGIQRLRSAKLEEVIEVRRAWRTYQPAILPKQAVADLNLIIGRNGQDPTQATAMIKKEAEAQLTELEQELAQHPDDLNLRKKLALKYARWRWRGDRLNLAKAQYREILALSADAVDSFAVYNDLANIYLLQEKTRLDSANIFYEHALKIARRISSPDTSGIHLNRGTLLLAMDGDTLAAKIYGLVVKDSTDLKGIRNAERYLQFKLIAPNDSVRADAKPKRPPKRVDRKKVGPKISGNKIVRGDRGARGEEIKLAVETAPKNISGWEIDDVFYWALKPRDDK